MLDEYHWSHLDKYIFQIQLIIIHPIPTEIYKLYKSIILFLFFQPSIVEKHFEKSLKSQYRFYGFYQVLSNRLILKNSNY